MATRTWGTEQGAAQRSTQSTRGFRLGRLAGFEIRLDFSVVLIFALVLFNVGAGVLPAWHPDWSSGLRWLVALVAALLFFVSILVHELSHAVVGSKLGARVRGITLFMFGGVAELEQEPDRAAGELWMALAGPAASLVIGVGSTLLGVWLAASGVGTLTDRPEDVLRGVGPLATLLLWLGPLNVMLAIFNLLPGFPLDGGRVLRAILWWATGDLQRATRWAAGAGIVLAWLMIAAGVAMVFGVRVPFFGRGFGSGLWLMLIGWFLSNAARSSYSTLVARRALDHVAVADVMWTRPDVASPDESVERLVRDKVLHSDQQVYPVVQGDTLVGAVTVGRLRRIPEQAWPTTLVAEVMTPRSELSVVTSDTAATRVLELLGGDSVQELAVEDGGRLRGLLRRQDVLRWLSFQVRPALPG